MREEPSEMPTVPDSVLVYVHAYGDSRADDDGRSGLRIGELILALRRWAKSIAAPTTQAAPVAQGDAEDAARLDWLATQQGHYCGVFSGRFLTRENIDAARTQAKEGGAT